MYTSKKRIVSEKVVSLRISRLNIGIEQFSKDTTCCRKIMLDSKTKILSQKVMKQSGQFLHKQAFNSEQNLSQNQLQLFDPFCGQQSAKMHKVKQLSMFSFVNIASKSFSKIFIGVIIFSGNTWVQETYSKLEIWNFLALRCIFGFVLKYWLLSMKTLHTQSCLSWEWSFKCSEQFLDGAGYFWQMS